jgi:hypothetical protein
MVVGSEPVGRWTCGVRLWVSTSTFLRGRWLTRGLARVRGIDCRCSVARTKDDESWVRAFCSTWVPYVQFVSTIVVRPSSNYRSFSHTSCRCDPSRPSRPTRRKLQSVRRYDFPSSTTGDPQTTSLRASAPSHDVVLHPPTPHPHPHPAIWRWVFTAHSLAWRVDGGPRLMMVNPGRNQNFFRALGVDGGGLRGKRARGGMRGRRWFTRGFRI